METNAEVRLSATIDKGRFALLDSTSNNSRIVLSKLYRASGRLESCEGYALFLPLAGRKQYVVNDEELTLAPGSFLLLNHNQDCTIHVDAPEQTVALNIRVHNSFVNNSAIENFRFQQGIFLLEGDNMSRYLKSLLAHINVEEERLGLNELEVYNQLAGHIVLLQQAVNRQITTTPARKQSTQASLYNRLYKAKLIMATNPCRPVNIGQVAKEVALSEAHFQRSFHAVFGISPYQFYLTKKMEQAVNFLAGGSMSLTDIAFETGFENLAVFSKAFKNKYGLSPTAFQQKNFCINANAASKNVA